MTIDQQFIRMLAGEAAWQRGIAYAEDGAISIVSADAVQVRATAAGTWQYNVWLRRDRDGVGGSCDCPVGERGQFCKHQVATLLVWVGLVQPAGDDDPGARGDSSGAEQGLTPARDRMPAAMRRAHEDRAQVDRWLATLDAPELRELLVEYARRDPQDWSELVARAGLATADADELKAIARRLIGRKRTLDWQRIDDYADRLSPLLRLLEERVQRDPALVLELAGDALVRLLPIYGQSDDSLGSLGDVLGELAGIHLQAAQQAAPDPRRFADYLLKLRLEDEWGLVAPVREYAEALTPAGIGRLEQRASARLDALEPKCEANRFDSDRLLLETVLAELAHVGGDVDAMLARRVRDAASGRDWLEIAGLYQEHGRRREAVQALERGLRAHPGEEGLMEALATELASDGLAEDAVAIRWDLFAREPNPPAYLELRKAAQALAAWNSWRPRALEQLSAVFPDPEERAAAEVGLYLAEEEFGAALEASRNVRLPRYLWEQLADAIASDHPEDAVRIHHSLLRPDLEPAVRASYERVLARLERMLPLYRRLGSVETLQTLLQELRETYRARRSFVAMLAAFASRL